MFSFTRKINVSFGLWIFFEIELKDRPDFRKRKEKKKTYVSHLTNQNRSELLNPSISFIFHDSIYVLINFYSYLENEKNSRIIMLLNYMHIV